MSPGHGSEDHVIPISQPQLTVYTVRGRLSGPQCGTASGLGHEAICASSARGAGATVPAGCQQGDLPAPAAAPHRPQAALWEGMDIRMFLAEHNHAVGICGACSDGPINM
jgi:hypothetical protein